MRVLLDECVPKRLRSELASHAVRTVAKFDCFLTVDRNLQFQQNVDALPLSVLVIRARDNRIATLRLIMPMVRDALVSLAANELKVVGA